MTKGNLLKYLSDRKQTALRVAPAVLLVLCTLALVQWKRSTSHASASSYPHEVSRITLAAAGDVIPHQAVVQAASILQSQAAAAARNPVPQTPETQTPETKAPEVKDAAAPPEAPNTHAGWDTLLAPVADVFRNADFAFVNLETPVAPAHSRGTKAFQFDAPILLLQSLKSSGVKIVSFANNHVFDQNQGGFAETLDHLREQGLLFAGSGPTAEAAWKPVIVEKNGIKVGWLGMTRWLNGHRNPQKAGEPHVAFVPYSGGGPDGPGSSEAEVLDAIRSARSECDLLLVSIHWGVEYAPAPQPRDVEFAHNMLEAGAGAIIGHHPHVLQPIETYLTKDQRNTVIIYSLGNFLSNQARNYVGGLMPDKSGDPRDSLVVRFSVVKRDYGPAGTRVELADMGILPVWGENNYLPFRSGHTKTPAIGPVFIDREIPPLRARLDELEHLDQLTNDQKQEVIKVSRKLELLEHRREILLARTGDEFLIPPPKQ
jgi:poly-gamma-glutamate capsule biosynthesis protein CapA/YwtB (metallophosphatase superfamily)